MQMYDVVIVVRVNLEYLGCEKIYFMNLCIGWADPL